MKTKIITSQQDTLGIILFNTSKSENSSKFKNISILLQIDEPNAETIKKLEVLEKSISSTTHPSATQTKISEVLWICQQEFKNYDQNEKYSNRIFFFTNDENPCKGDKSELALCWQKARDLGEASVDLDLFPMSKPDS